ncbi:PREDICTED: uncharacterized protein LOC108556735 [Nicrophorus vespilloides]|uniref:N-acetylneuraminate lyase n=1 Tax=Nicrophorus vespilloides TaxID=110193 RepID=A0ABM1M1J1_NICVS|nr:PREDICTED: uncharacterized protein LOC108556735 [Nicrophorus vespilloides]
MSDQGESESEEIIIETECLLDEEPQSNTVLLTDLKTEFKSENDDDFTWEEDTFQSFDPPTKKPIKQRKRANGAGGKVKTSIQKYKKDWENIPEFKKWLSMSLLGSEYFYCKICKVDAKCGKSEIMRHMTSKKHKKNAQDSVPKFKCFDGLLCPVFTPIDRLRFEEVHYTKISEYSDYLKRNNIRSVLINDITGEGMSLTVSERCLITEEWARETKKNKQYLMVQIGGAPLKEVVRMVSHIFQISAKV